MNSDDKKQKKCWLVRATEWSVDTNKNPVPKNPVSVHLVRSFEDGVDDVWNEIRKYYTAHDDEQSASIDIQGRFEKIVVTLSSGDGIQFDVEKIQKNQN